MEALQVQSSLPDLPPEDKALLGRLLALSEDLTKLAEETKTDLLDLFQWHARSDIQAYIRHQRAQVAYLQTQRAIAALEEIVKTTSDPIEQRRAANTILRVTGAAPEHASKDQDQETRSRVPRGHFLTTAPTPYKPALEEALEILAQLNGGLVQDQDGDEDDKDNDDDPPPPNPTRPPTPTAAAPTPQPSQVSEAAAGAPHGPSTQDSGRSRPKTPLTFPPHIEKPDPNRTPHELSALILEALERPDHPSKGDGFLTLYSLSLRPAHHTHEELQSGTQALKQFLPAALGHKSAKVSEFLIHQDQALQHITFTHKSRPPQVANLILTRAPLGPDQPRAWYLLSLQHAGP